MGINEINNLTIEDIKPLTVSFKKTEDELILYKWILIQSGFNGFSGYIKNQLNLLKENETSKKENKSSVKSNTTELIDLNDF